MTSAVAQTLIEMLQAGVLDDDLDELISETNLRLSALGMSPISTPALPISSAFHIGDKVRVRTAIKPKYLAGITGQVIGQKVRGSNRFLVRIDPAFVSRCTRFIQDGAINFPASTIEKIA